MKKALFKSVMVLSSTLMLLIPFTGLADDYLYVDVNRDGEVNIADVNAVIAAILGGYTPPSDPALKPFTVNGVSFNMVKVQGGMFTMGADDDDTEAFSDEKPQRVVQLSDYYIGETEVTQELWYAVMGSQPSIFTGGQNPVDHVSWEECKEFIRKLNALTGQQFRFPTEAEWEFAARGGNKSNGCKYAGSDNLNEVGWWGSEIGGNNMSYSTQPVAQLAPNELGIYDMSGNVIEWCNDWYGIYPAPLLHASTGMIYFDDIPYGSTQTTASFTVSGSRLSDDVYITVEGNNGFTVTPQHIGVTQANSSIVPINVTYSGPRDLPAEGVIKISSKNANDYNIQLRYHCPSLEVLANNPIKLENIASPFETFKVIGYNLSGNVTFSVDGNGFSITPGSVTPDNNGTVNTDVTVSMPPEQLGTNPVIGTITVSAPGLAEQTITVIAQLNPTIEIVPDGPIMLEDSTSTSATFRVIGHNLIEDVSLRVEDEGFSVTPTTIQPNNIGDVNEEITVSFSDTLSSEPVIGTITIKSTGIEKTIEVIAQLKADSEAPVISFKPMQTQTNNVGSDYEGYVDVDPRGPTYGSYRIMRGGAWNSQARFCRVSYRYARESTFTNFIVGLRLAL